MLMHMLFFWWFSVFLSILGIHLCYYYYYWFISTFRDVLKSQDDELF